MYEYVSLHCCKKSFYIYSKKQLLWLPETYVDDAQGTYTVDKTPPG